MGWSQIQKMGDLTYLSTQRSSLTSSTPYLLPQPPHSLSTVFIYFLRHSSYSPRHSSLTLSPLHTLPSLITPHTLSLFHSSHSLPSPLTSLSIPHANSPTLPLFGPPHPITSLLLTLTPLANPHPLFIHPPLTTPHSLLSLILLVTPRTPSLTTPPFHYVCRQT